MWPDSTTPPATLGPMVANIAALSPLALGTRAKWDALLAQIVLDRSDQRQIRLRTLGVESDEARREIDRRFESAHLGQFSVGRDKGLSSEKAGTSMSNVSPASVAMR